MPKMNFSSEAVFTKKYNNYTETAVYKLLLPYKYTKLFVDLINPSSSVSFPEAFEDDLEFQEIIYEAYGDIDDDDFEDEVEFLKENSKKDPSFLREIFDIFLDEGVLSVKGTKTKNDNLLEETCLVRDLTQKHPDYLSVLK